MSTRQTNKHSPIVCKSSPRQQDSSDKMKTELFGHQDMALFEKKEKRSKQLKKKGEGGSKECERLPYFSAWRRGNVFKVHSVGWEDENAYFVRKKM